jgi:hypothetical protein
VGRGGRPLDGINGFGWKRRGCSVECLVAHMLRIQR